MVHNLYVFHRMIYKYSMMNFGIERIYFFKDLIYLFMTDRERERQRHRQREKQAPRREPNVGLDPESPGSRLGLKEALNR